MKQAEKKIANRRRILDAAAKIFTRDGLMNASMRNIANEAGCTTGTIYPLFNGKEALYVALLTESLDRLYTAVSTASSQETEDLDALITAVAAFYHYYESNAFEANLGMYIYGMGQVKSMGREPDNLLNKKLLRTLAIFATCLEKLAPDQLSKEQKSSWIMAERDLIFTMLIGILTMQRSGRAKSIGTTHKAIFSDYVAQLRSRYQQAVAN